MGPGRPIGICLIVLSDKRPIGVCPTGESDFLRFLRRRGEGMIILPIPTDPMRVCMASR
jgi:hypothetical protein